MGHLASINKDHILRKAASMNYFTIQPKPCLKEYTQGSEFLTKEISEQIGKLIPHRIISKGWRLAYSRSRDGASYERYLLITRLLRACRGKGELLFIIQDIKDGIFGGYFSQNLEIKTEYFGTGESFLFLVKVEVAYRERGRRHVVPTDSPKPILLLLQQRRHRFWIRTPLRIVHR